MAMMRGVFSTTGELFAYLWRQRLWWLIPVVLLLLVFGLFIVLGSSSGLGPLMYTVF
jgi:hypothetical protein